MIKSLVNTKLIVNIVFALFLLFGINQPLSARKYSNQSVLSSGNWVKIKIGDTGVYKLTYNQLKAMGIVNPQNVQVFGYGGNILSEDFSLNDYIDDLPQVAIWMSSPKDSFGVNDYILFYGNGTIKWTYNNRSEFIQTQNPYSSEAFYFLTESSENTKIAPIQKSEPDNSVATLTSYQDYYLHEKELVNISQTGRHFYGESFDKERSQTFSFPLKGALSTSNASINYEFISYPRNKDREPDPGSAFLNVTLNGTNTKKKEIKTPENTYTVASIATESYSQVVAENNTIKFDYTKRSDNDQRTHLNYFRVNYTRTLQPYGAVTLFRSTNLNTKVNFAIANIPNNSLILDVSDATNIKIIEGSKENDIYKFSAGNTTIKEYALVDLSKDIPSPTFVKNVDNQNLHSLEGKEMVIIIQPHLKAHAERLAAIHLNNSGLESLIVHPEDIFNEFSSGTPDATAYRSFLKMLYDNAYMQGIKPPRYLLLFGDGTFDNRFISDAWNDIDTRAILLTYQSENSTSEVNSFVSDDYFGFLDDNEGGNLKNNKLDLGIGRLPVRSNLEAHNMVNKIERYLKNEDQGEWQNNVLFIADDAIAGGSSLSTSERVHMEYSDSIAERLNKNFPDFRTTKLYMDTYERGALINNSPRNPEGKKQIFKNINSGALVLNFMGHGSQHDWTHEFILISEDVINLKNKNLPLWITATCDFSRFDYNATSSGELALLNPNGGAIALFSTVRIVFASSNKLINTSMFEHIFTEENGMPLRLGDIIRYSKTKSSLSAMETDANKLRFLLLGDPALRLNHPSSKNRISIESINGLNASSTETITIEALSAVSIKGSIVDETGKLDKTFNGYIETNAFDNQQRLATRGQKTSVTTVSNDSISLDYNDYVNKIFSGKTRVDNGQFEISFTVPKDVLYSGNNGKMFFIAYDSTEPSKSAKGSFSKYKVVRGNSNLTKETTPPAIKNLYIENEAFVSGTTIANEAMLFATISDNTGLNLAEGLGHGITATINGIVYDITSSFITDPQSAKSGTVKYQLPSLTAGKYTLVLKAWDVWNNSSSQTINFVIDKDENLSYTFDIANKVVSDDLELIFSTESSKSDIALSYKVYDKSNNLKWIHETNGKSTTLSNHTYAWNLIGNDGIKLKPGSYTCKVKIKIGHIEEEKTYDFVVL